mmetsp:Transcript_460/g.1306  ORF Transcript_460/g.1306 Transcript_460/m.1306 type:complete len:87 (-) Transcript_460:1320-1580(-)
MYPRRLSEERQNQQTLRRSTEAAAAAVAALPQPLPLDERKEVAQQLQLQPLHAPCVVGILGLLAMGGSRCALQIQVAVVAVKHGVT